jgi:hypothetical protein
MKRRTIMKKIALLLALMLTLPSLAMGHDTTEDAGEWTKRSGIRFGYVYAHNFHKDSDKLSSPHMSTMGYELQQTMPGGDWLDILFIQNVTITGMDQSVLAPSARLLIGFEINDSIQLAVGPNGAPKHPSDNFIHLMVAVGYTAEAGMLSIPFHFSYVPDADGYYTTSLTTGVNW